MVHPFQNLMQIPATDYHLNPHVELYSPPFAANCTVNFQNSDTDLGVIGNFFSKKFSSQFMSSSSLRHFTNDKLGIQEMINEFPEQQSPHQTSFVQLLEEHSNDMELNLHTRSDPVYLRLPVLEELHNKIVNEINTPQQLNSSNKVSVLLELDQTEGLSVSADSDISPAPSNTIMQSECRIYDPRSRTNLPVCSHQASARQSASYSYSEKSQKQARAATNLPFSSGHSQSSYGTENQIVKPKRKRKKSYKNGEEAARQRQTHIVVERNRRKQMNEHLNILRSMMPGSYMPRGSQASIVGGAIEFVRELEQLLECLEAQKLRKLYTRTFSFNPCDSFPLHHQQVDSQNLFMTSDLPPDNKHIFAHQSFYELPSFKEIFSESKSRIAEVEVQMMGNNVFMKILSPKISGQLLKTIAALESLGMTIMGINITTVEQTVLYSFNVKLEVECQLNTAEETAAAVQQIFEMIHKSTV